MSEQVGPFQVGAAEVSIVQVSPFQALSCSNLCYDFFTRELSHTSTIHLQPVGRQAWPALTVSGYNVGTFQLLLLWNAQVIC